MLAATALFGSYRDAINTALPTRGRRRRRRRVTAFAYEVFSPNTLVGVIIGASVVFMFSGLAINAVTRAAGAIVFEVRRQFRENPGIMDYSVRPEYGRVVDICTRDSLRELATPGLLAIFAPIAVGFGLGVGPLAGYLAGAIACRHPDGGLPGQLRWRVGQRQEARRGRQPRRQGLARARGHHHR